MAPVVPIAQPRRARCNRARGWMRWMAAVWLCLLASGAWAQAKPSEYEVKAAYLFNFGKFMRIVGGPAAQSGSVFNICILGRDPIGRAMDEIADNESIDGRRVHVLRIADATQAHNCDIVFISPYEGAAIREDLAIIAGTNVLTVSDAPDFLELGGMIQFLFQGDHVRFAVNLDAVNRTKLVLSSELLRVAVSIKGGPPGGPQ